MRKSALLLLLICVSTKTVWGTFDHKPCGKGWLSYKADATNTYCYLFHNVTDTLKGHNFNDSRIACQRLGGDLLSIGSEGEFNFIAGQFKDQRIKRQKYWIGLTDMEKENVYKWTDGTAYNKTLTHWRTSSREPNNWQNEDCAETTWDGQWNDNDCQRLYGFICKAKNGSQPLAPPTLPPIPINTEKPLTCEAGWIPWGSSCYGIIGGFGKKWKDARADCLRRFGDLLVINSQAEQDFMTNTLSNINSDFWIGLTDRFKESEFYWEATKEKLNASLANWRTGQPDNFYGNEDCVEMSGRMHPGKWNDNHCSAEKSYICEKNSGIHNCPDGWVTYGDYCYQVNAHDGQRADYAGAERECHAHNVQWEERIDVAEAELVSILSADEQQFLNNQIQPLVPSWLNKLDLWIGLNSINETNGQVHWTDKSKYVYENLDNSADHLTKTAKCYSSSFYKKPPVTTAGKGQWKVQQCSRRMGYICKLKRGADRCYNPMGMQGFQIPNSALSASSQLSITTPPAAGRLYLKNTTSLDGAWCGGNTSPVWYEIDFGQVEKLTYMAIQGKANSKALLKEFYIKYSLDGVSFDVYGDIPPHNYYKFKTHPETRGTNFEKVMTLPLPTAFVARFVRIYPLRWIEAPCLRVEFYGCKQDVNVQKCGLGWEENPVSKHCYKFTSQSTTWDAANSICEAEGAHLLSVSSKAESEYLRRRLTVLSAKHDMYWMGVNDQDALGWFRWSDNTPTFFTNWDKKPRKDVKESRCGVILSSEGKWDLKDCYEYRPFICKRKFENPYIPKQSFNNNWRSAADFYWPLDDDKYVAGTTNGQYFGAVQLPPEKRIFPVPYVKGDYRYTLKFNGKNNYVMTDLKHPCVGQPVSAQCPYGFTLSVLFKMTYPKPFFERRYLVDGMEKDTLGYQVYVVRDQLTVHLKGADRDYVAEYIHYSNNEWNHLIFTHSKTRHLNVYMNGKLVKTQTVFTPTNPSGKRAASRLYIARSAQRITETKDFTEAQITSLALFKRELTLDDVSKIYVAELGQCSFGEVAVGSQCYAVYLTSRNWNAAHQACLDRNASLVSVHNPVEQAYLTLTSLRNTPVSGMWIGLNSRAQPDSYNWTDGSPFSFTHWRKYEPNRYLRQREDCVEEDGLGGWNDESCFTQKPYMCKRSRAVNEKSVTEHTERTVKFYYYQMKTFGCPLTKIVNVKSVYYGIQTNNCFFPQDFAIKMVNRQCKGSMCRSVRASDYFFNKTNPCMQKTRFGSSKRMNVTYTCIADPKSPSLGGCPVGYSVSPLDERICYRLYNERMNVTRAAKRCEGDHPGTSHLASIHSRTEQLYVTTLMGRMYERRSVWLGMRYDDIHRRYQWMNNNTVNYTHWYNKQPDHRKGKYIKMSLHNGARDFLFWEGAEDSEELPFLCRALKPNKGGDPTASTKTTTGTNQTCTQGWYSYGNDCYYIDNKTLSFNDAEQRCRDLGVGGHLASVQSYIHNEAIFKIAVNSTLFFGWLGLSNQGLINGYHWTDGAPLDFVNWYTGYPYKGSRHLCGGMMSSGQWMEMACYTKQMSVCRVPKGNVKPTLAPTQPTTTQDPSACEKGWRLFNGNCYYFSHNSERADFHNAQAICLTKNASLVTITSKEENDFIDKVNGNTYYVDRPWIGLNDLEKENGWTWADGTPATYFNFRKGQPDDWHGMEDCVEIMRGGDWNDLACNMKHVFICEKSNKSVSVTPTPPVNPTPKPDQGYCMQGWKLYGDKCYLIRKGPQQRLNYNDAHEYCRQWPDGDLVSIHSDYENSFLLSQLADAREDIYIGLTDRMSEGKFLWTDQTSVSFVNWYVSQPSRYGQEDCVEMMPYVRQAGRWNDVKCDKENGFICQLKSTKTPPPTKVPPTVDPDPCPAGYIKYGKSCYRLMPSNATWEGARDQCKKQEGGELVSIHSPFEQAFLLSYFGEKTLVFWTGLHKHAGEEDLHWSDNSPRTYKNWKFGRAVYPSKDSTKCVLSEANAKWTKIMTRGQWRGESCDSKIPYICKVNREEYTVEHTFKGNCTEGWSKFRDKCYKLYKLYYYKVEWGEARQKCVSEGGDLAAITDREVQNHIYSLAYKSFTSAWIGLNDLSMEHSWTWSATGGALGNYTNWAFNEPSDNSGKENCVEMHYTNGQWNDLGCHMKRNYICEHQLECRQPLGMVDKTITENQVNATSWVPGYEPGYARLNRKRNGKHVAWCTNITDTQQSLTIDFGEYMTITRIASQGLPPRNHVTAYTLEFSDDGGTSWQTYYTEDNSKLLPGNQAADRVEGVLLNIRASKLRITPKRFVGDLVCMRLELYGCKSVCSKALGMENFNIPISAITVSSEQKDHPKNYSRPLYKLPWCAETADAEQWLQVDLGVTHKVTRVMVRGEGTLVYSLVFSDDGRTWRPYLTRTGQKKLFPTKPSIHELEKPESTRYVAFRPKKWNKKICLQVEVYGCIISCDQPMGLESGLLPDRFMKASSELAKYQAAKGRLLTGSSTNTGWCSAYDDKYQFLTVSFPKMARLTGMAIQGAGSEGKTNYFVSRFNFQWSFDGKFWQHFETMEGNSDSVSVRRIKFEYTIQAMHVRVNPVKFTGGVCMKIEIYGCPIDFSPTQPPPPMKKQTSRGSLLIKDLQYSNALSNTNSVEYRQLATHIESLIEEVYVGDETFRSGFEEVIIEGFRKGSVIVDFALITNTPLDSSNDPFIPLKKQLATGSIGDYKVDAKSLQTGDHRPKKEGIKKGEGGLSNGAKVGLISFFVVALIVVLFVGVIYYMRRRHSDFKLQFKHTSFENPTHDDEMNVQFMNDESNVIH